MRMAVIQELWSAIESTEKQAENHGISDAALLIDTVSIQQPLYQQLCVRLLQ
jgi:hypothetical protein